MNDFTAWLARGEIVLPKASLSKWEVADWLLDAEDAYYDLVPLNQNWIRRAADYFKIDYYWLLEHRRVGKIFPPSTRVANLSFGHHRVIAAIEDSDARARWLSNAENQHWSVTRLRKEIAADRAASIRAIGDDFKDNYYTYSAEELAQLKDLQARMNLSEKQLTVVIVRRMLRSTTDLTGFIDLYKASTPPRRVAYQLSLGARNGGTLKRWTTA